jgi:hypothetical protein
MRFGIAPIGAAAGSVGKSLQREASLLVPDLPRWVEVRSMLLSGGAILGDVSTHPPAFVVLQATTGQMAVVGHPSRDTIQAAARQAQEIIALPENADWTTAALPDWIGEPATIHVLGQSPRLPPVPPGTVRRLAAEEVSALSGLPPDLREELLVEAQAAGGTSRSTPWSPSAVRATRHAARLTVSRRWRAPESSRCGAPWSPTTRPPV